MPDGSTNNAGPNRARWLPAFCTAILLFVAYVLSYAPVVRLHGGNSRFLPVVSGDIVVYKPVDWLIDKTPLHDPLTEWAEAWGVGDDFEYARRLRELDRAIEGLHRTEQK